MPHVHFHKGFIPFTFAGLEDSKISFSHIDLDLYQCYLDALNFIYPRMTSGGVIVFDDYAAPTCKGATLAVNEFFGEENVKIMHQPNHNSYYIIK